MENQENTNDINNLKNESGSRIVKTDENSINGQDKCPKCGATDISVNVKTGKLRCNFCRYEFEAQKVEGLVTDIENLEGSVIGSGAQDIVADTNDILTFKCSSCGAEVVIDTASSTQARCHWCRNTLSVNQQIPNGVIPDVVLPFSVNKDVAKVEIEKFVSKRKFFAHPKFKEEFTLNNVMGVYFPYMLIDINGHANLSGEGEHQTRRYYRRVGDRDEVYYDADLYHVEREFDVAINGLSIESSSDKLNNNSNKTNNVINAIMPFDVENCVKYNSNYLKGFTSERRDTNISSIKKIADVQAKDIARYAANDTIKQYDRGVAWSNESFEIKGEQWQAAYLPVWLYSYQQIKGNQKILHYVALNARTKEVMGSIPIHIPKLVGMSVLVEFLGILAMLVLDFDLSFIFLLSGFIYFFIMYSKYRNAGARHTYELETKKKISNLRKVDNFIRKKTGLSNSKMSGANNMVVKGQSIKSNVFNSVTAQNLGENVVNTITNNSFIASAIKDSIDKKN